MALYINGNKASGGTDIVHLTQAQYDALPSSKNYDGKVYMITDVNGDGESFHPIIYSENEREIGVWVDGKPLYQKSYNFDNTSSESININISILNIDRLVKTEFSVRNSTSDHNQNAGGGYYESSADKINCYYNNNDNVIRIRRGTDFSKTSEGILTIQYTKTTDTAGSGTWTPQGVPAVHYSTDEQVVGTWIDGKTIYEKTFINLSQSTSGTSWISLSQIDASGWEQLIDLKIYGENNSGIYIGMALAEFSLDNSTPTHPSMSLCGSFDRTITKAICRYTKSSQGGN